MRYKDIEVTLANYKDIFSAKLPEIQDEIRSAILDDTPIGAYIDECGIDSYKLSQIRCAMRELIDPDYLDVLLSGDTIFYIRMGFRANIYMGEIKRYIGVLEPEMIEKIAKTCYLGVDVSKMDFTKVRQSLFDIMCQGLAMGYPMWLLQDIEIDDTRYIEKLMQGLKLGFDIHPFISNRWSETVLSLLFSLDKSIYTKVLPYINYSVDSDVVKYLIDCIKNNKDASVVMKKDNEGWLIYDSYQCCVLLNYLSQGYDISKALDVHLSDKKMEDIIKGENNIV